MSWFITWLALDFEDLGSFLFPARDAKSAETKRVNEINTNDYIKELKMKSGITNIITPLLRHFTILGQKNVPNMPRYYTVEQGKNTD